MTVEFANLAGFAIAALAIVLSPGPDTMLLLRYTMNGGQKIGFATVLGIQLGLVVHTAAAVLGLSLLIVKAPTAFQAIAIAGALYLAWLALQSVRAGVVKANGDGAVPLSFAKAGRDAALTNILNPKVILLYLALMPNFVTVERGGVPAQLIALGITLIIINVAWQAPLVLAAGAMRRWLGTPSVQHWVNWITGAILMTFAVLMLLEHVFQVRGE